MEKIEVTTHWLQMLLLHLEPAEDQIRKGLLLSKDTMIVTCPEHQLEVNDCFDNALPDVMNAITYIEDKIAEAKNGINRKI